MSKKHCVAGVLFVAMNMFCGGALGLSVVDQRNNEYAVDALISFGSSTNYTLATINSAISAIGNDTKVLLLCPGTWTITDDLTIPSNITLRIVPGALLAISTTKTLTINGPPELWLGQVFNCVGTGKVVFGSGSVKEVYPQWWGASPSATAAANSTAFQSALNSLVAYDMPNILIPAGIYEINAELKRTSADYTHIKGQGSGTQLKWTGADYATMLSLTGASSGGVVVESIYFNLNKKASSGLQLNGFGHIATVKRVEFAYGLDNPAGNVIGITGIVSGVCSTTNTQGISVGNTVTFLSGTQADPAGVTKFIVTAVATNTSFTIDDTSITHASAHTAQRCSTKGMLDLTIVGETHNGRVEQCMFFVGTALGISMGLSGVSSGSGGWVITNNEFMQINNYAIKGKGVKESEISNNIIDHVSSWRNGGGFLFDISSHMVIRGNHMESCYKPFVTINPTSEYGFKTSAGRIADNLFVAGGNPSDIVLGYTHFVAVENNGSMGDAGKWLTVSANAMGTILGRNNYSSGSSGDLAWHEQYVTGAGKVNHRYGQTPVFSRSALLALTSQSASANWVTLTQISTTNNPNIPDDARAFIVQASIKSTTPGARLYLVSTGGAPLWTKRASDMRVQYIEAQVAGRYNTAVFTIPAMGDSPDQLNYGISDGGVAGTDVELRLIGYLMPT